MKRVKNLVALALIVLVMSSCATLFTGTKETVQIESDPSGASIKVNGIDRGKTPAPVELKKGNVGESIILTRDGYKKRVFQPETTFNGVSVLNTFNLLFWGIDAATGALWKYDPNYYNIELEPVKE